MSIYIGDDVADVARSLTINTSDDLPADELRKLIYNAVDELEEIADELKAHAHWDRNYID